MKIITSNGLLEYMLQYAKDDAETVNCGQEPHLASMTGWCSLGDLSCAYYPNSQRHAFFMAKLGVSNRRDAEEWLSTQLGMKTTQET